MNLYILVIILSVLSSFIFLSTITGKWKGTIKSLNLLALKKYLIKPKSKLHYLFWNPNNFNSFPQHTFINAIYIIFLYINFLIFLIFCILASIFIVQQKEQSLTFIIIFLIFTLSGDFLDITIVSVYRYINSKYKKLELKLKQKEIKSIEQEIKALYPDFFDDIMQR